MPSYQRELPAEDSWRVVDGENDSFDTSILPSFVSDEDGLLGGYPSSGQPSSALPSQLSSGDQASQDSIRDFARHREDDNVILREPFRPTMYTASTSRRANGGGGVRRRQRNLEEKLSMALEQDDARDDHGVERSQRRPTKHSMAPSLSVPLQPPTALGWYLLIPGIALVTYIVLGVGILVYNLATYPLAFSVLPLSSTTGNQPPCIDFGDFAEAHHILNGVLQRQRDLAVLSWEVEQSGSTVAQLRPLVEADNIAHKALVLRTFDNYHVSAADIVHSIENVYASADTAANGAIQLANSAATHLQSLVAASDTPRSPHSDLLSYFLSPFKVPEERVEAYYLRHRYLEHAAYLSGTVSDLLGLVTHLISLLDTAGVQIRTIIRLGPQPADEAPAPQAQLGWNQWTLLAVKSAQLRLVHHSMQVLNDVLARDSDSASELQVLVRNLQMLKKDLDMKVKKASLGTAAVPDKKNCATGEDQVELLSLAAASLHNSFHDSRNERGARR